MCTYLCPSHAVTNTSQRTQPRQRSGPYLYYGNFVGPQPAENHPRVTLESINPGGFGLDNGPFMQPPPPPPRTETQRAACAGIRLYQRDSENIPPPGKPFKFGSTLPKQPFFDINSPGECQVKLVPIINEVDCQPGM